MVLLGTEVFLLKLGELYENHKGSVWVTVKTYYPQLKGSMDSRRTCEIPEEAEPVCLVRASTGKKTISCHVDRSSASEFSQTLAQLTRLKVGTILPKKPPVGTGDKIHFQRKRAAAEARKAKNTNKQKDVAMTD
eukprot:Lankesteria_metandrocarpae@DN1717_c0_g1_i2.p1